MTITPTLLPKIALQRPIYRTSRTISSRLIPASWFHCMMQVVFDWPWRDLNPELVVQDKIFIKNTAALGAIPAADLRRPLANLASQNAAIQNALDTLFGGF